MAKKSSKANTPSKQSSSSGQKSKANSLTPSTSSPKPPPTSLFAKILDIRAQRTFQLILLAALSAQVSQLNLAPVYGSIPSALYHRWGVSASFLLALGLRGYVPKWLARWIAPFAFWIPGIQFFLFQLSSYLGNPLGPVLTEVLTCYPLIMASASTALDYYSELGGGYHDRYEEVGPAVGLFALLAVLQRAATSVVSSFSGPGFLRSRVGLHLILATLYAMIIPHTRVWMGFPAVTFTLLVDSHCLLDRTTDVMNNTLALHDYSLLERRESITGYLSVLEDHTKGFRVMRCDHSLLGGEWQLPITPGKTPRIVGEPIYPVFTMLEAVRLVEPQPSHSDKKALNIGLGIGTAPAALIAHGVHTTILEIDPVVHEFAVKYFGLPTNHTIYIGDAVQAVTAPTAKGHSHPATSEAESYDYIIHDVFTGGAEPVDLFTAEFLSGLRLLLKSDGVIAINYAGDVAMPAASIIHRTINSVFPSCRVFREDEPPAPGSKPDDFTNMVFFCRKDDVPVAFRDPKPSDWLGSSTRRLYMLPKHEIPASAFDDQAPVLRSGKTAHLEKWHAKSALGHWHVMRTVLPDAIWENW